MGWLTLTVRSAGRMSCSESVLLTSTDQQQVPRGVRRGRTIQDDLPFFWRDDLNDARGHSP